MPIESLKLLYDGAIKQGKKMKKILLVGLLLVERVGFASSIDLTPYKESLRQTVAPKQSEFNTYKNDWRVALDTDELGDETRLLLALDENPNDYIEFLGNAIGKWNATTAF